MITLAYAPFTRLHNLDSLPEDWFEEPKIVRPQIRLRCGVVVGSLNEASRCPMAKNCEYADQCQLEG